MILGAGAFVVDLILLLKLTLWHLFVQFIFFYAGLLVKKNVIILDIK